MTSSVHNQASLVGGHAEPGSSRGAGFARELERALSRVDADPSRSATDAVRSGDPHRILERQAALYRHAERVELVSRLADHAVGSVKTLLQTRV